MSEYQYYEFQAIDRLLEPAELRALRQISTRASITPTHFSNHYEWGDLKADPLSLLARYFDVFVYLSNFRYRRLAFRLPKAAAASKVLKAYAKANRLTIETRGDFHLVVFGIEAGDDEDEDYEDDESGWMTTLAGLRADILAGDYRALYLGWLTTVHVGEDDDDRVEPPCPPGLKELSGPLDALVDFLWLDRDLVAAAAETSEPLEQKSDGALERWVASLGDAEKTRLLLRVAQHDSAVAGELATRFRRETATTRPTAARRRVEEIQRSAEGRQEERLRAEAKRAAAAEQRRKAQEQKAREEYLIALGQREADAWRRVETHIGVRNPKHYAAAADLLVDLREVASRKGELEAFAGRLEALRAKHSGKANFLSRLRARL